MARAVGVNRATWERRLAARRTAPNSDVIADGVAAALESLGDGGVGRRGTHHVDRCGLVRLAEPANTGVARVALFVATLMWGSGTTNGRGPRYTAAALGDRRVLQTLERTRVQARELRFAEAFRSLSLTGVGPCFYTKWLWSSTLDQSTDRRPLILDDPVIGTLNGLGWFLSDGARRRADRYLAYVDLADAVSTELPSASTGEHVEALLVDREPGSLAEHLGVAV
jgi:hypothetical protein